MSRFFRRKKFCRFTAEGVKEIDYKDIVVLKNYVSETGTVSYTHLDVYKRQLQRGANEVLAHDPLQIPA